MSKSRSKYYDDYDEFDYRPYGRKSEYLDRKRAKRMERAMRTKDIDGMLERSRGDQGNTMAAFEVLIAAFVGMSALLGGILVGARFLPEALADGDNRVQQRGVEAALAMRAVPGPRTACGRG